MKEFKEEYLVYMSDEMYTPIHYKGMVVKQPYFEGRGNHSVAELETICEQFKEYVHQQQVIKQGCMKAVVNLKFGVEFEDMDDEEPTETCDNPSCRKYIYNGGNCCE
jgi:hypothetical protein